MSDLKDFKIKKNPYSEEAFLSFYNGKESVVEIPEGVTNIEPYAFADEVNPNTSIQKIIVPSSVIDIDNFAFSYCKNLTEIDWEKCKTIHLGVDIFKGCDSLEKISIPKSVSGILHFSTPKNLKTIELHDDFIYVNPYTFDRSEEGLKKMNAPFRFTETINILLQNPVYKIVDGFMINSKLKTVLFLVDKSKSEIRIPDGIEVISLYAFDDYMYFEKGFRKNDYLGNEIVPLEKVILPASVKELKIAAFTYCYHLKSVKYEGNINKLIVDNEAFKDCGDFEKNGKKIEAYNTERKGTFAMIDRFSRIHRKIKSGCYPNAKELLEACKDSHLASNELSQTTINRDIKRLRDLFGAPIVFDKEHKGYCYTEDFELNLEKGIFV